MTFLGCSFSFPARSAQRWRRWQLHGSAVPVAAVRPRQDAGEAAAAPPARGQRLLPGTEAPFRALPSVSWQHLTPHTALTTPAPLGDRSQSSYCFGCFCSCGSLGCTRGSQGCPCLPLPSTTKEAEMPPVQLRVLLPCLPQGPSRALGVQLEVGGQRVPGGAAGKAMLSQQGLESWSDRAGRGSGPWLSLGWWLGATKAVRAAVPGQSSSFSLDGTCSHPVGAVNPLLPLSSVGLGCSRPGCGWRWSGGVQPFSLQPQELLYGWGEAGPAPPSCPACHSLRSLDSMIVRLCAPSLTL